jgi:hypothetical protein
MSQKKLNPNLLQGIEGTLLGEVLSTTGKEITTFLKKLEAATELNKKIGEVLPLEAALFLHATNAEIASQKMKTDYEAEVSKQAELAKKKNELIPPIEEMSKFVKKLKQVRSESQKLDEKSELFTALAWNSINTRLGNTDSLKLCKNGIITDDTGDICATCGKVHDKSARENLAKLIFGDLLG